MRQAAVALCLLSMIATASSEAKDVLIIRKNTSYVFDDPQFELYGKRVVLDDPPPDDDQAAAVVNSLLPSEMELKRPFTVRTSTGLRNGFAVIHNGKRYIVVDINFYLWESGRWNIPQGPGIGDHWAPIYLVLGHEIGHHVCGHTAGKMQQNPWERELEADRFGGAAFRNAELDDIRKGILNAEPSIAQVINAARRRYSLDGSATHPPQEQRVAAIWQGYNTGFPPGCPR